MYSAGPVRSQVALATLPSRLCSASMARQTCRATAKRHGNPVSNSLQRPLRAVLAPPAARAAQRQRLVVFRSPNNIYM